jgi:elongation factor 1-gamma
MSFGNSEVLPKFGGWYRPLIGLDPYNKKAVEESSKGALRAVGVLEQHLTTNTFLVGERLTLADIFVAGLCSRAFTLLLSKAHRAERPAFTRWYETIVNQPIYQGVVPEATFTEEGLKNAPPKKEEAPKPKPAAAATEEEPKPAPKPKHPLEALPKPTLVLDEWKRKYSNEDARTVALPWFWENYKPDEYSLWQFDYKYNNELGMTFMSNNLIGE